jgi:hypothetical protein
MQIDDPVRLRLITRSIADVATRTSLSFLKFTSMTDLNYVKISIIPGGDITDDGCCAIAAEISHVSSITQLYLSM